MINKVFLLGRLGRDPEIRYTESGTAVATFSMATDRTWKKDGETQKQTDWHRVVAFGRTAEVVGEYCKQGSLIHVEGRMQTRSYEDKEGITRWTTEVIVTGLKLVGTKNGGQRREEPPPPGEEDVPF